MGCEVILTGTGVPAPIDPTRAGPGVLVRVDDLRLQFDAGRATILRLAALGVECPDLTTVFLTHHHSDHLMGLPDLAISRWLTKGEKADTPLPIIAPAGPCEKFVKRMLDPWADDIDVRRAHSGRQTSPGVDLETFEVQSDPNEIWSQDEVSVKASEVRHPPVYPSVGYRIETPYGIVVISGDTFVCPEIEELARGADILVHEALCLGAVRKTPYRFVADYHSNATQIGAMAARAGVETLMLTHLIPPPSNKEEAQAFESDVRKGGYDGNIIVGEDLAEARLPYSSASARIAQDNREE